MLLCQKNAGEYAYITGDAWYTNGSHRNGTLPWLRPDTKTQVTVEYAKDGGAVKPLRVDTVVVSAQHSDDISTEQLRKEIKTKIIQEVIPSELLDERTVYHVSIKCLFFIVSNRLDSTIRPFRHWWSSRRCWFDR